MENVKNMEDKTWSVGPEVRKIIYQIVKTGIHKNILEIGCYNGYSTSAFVDALTDGTYFKLTLCDIDIKPSVINLAKKHPNKISIKNSTSVEVLKNCCDYDLIFVDGDHSISVVGHELMFLLKNNPKTIIAHDTMTPRTPGSMLLKQIYDNHKDYYGITLFNPKIEFLNYGTSFYSKEKIIIEKISQIIEEVLKIKTHKCFL